MSTRTFFCVLLSLLFVVVIQSAPAKIILDTDIGTDFDDTWALLYILSRPDLFDLRLVQVSTYNTAGRAQIAAKILDLLHHTHIPLAIGYPSGDQFMPQYAWAKDYSLDEFKAHGGVVSSGIFTFQTILEQATPNDPVYIVEIAPANSLGDILMTNPRLSENCVCVAMSGSVYRGYFNSTEPAAEYNVLRNISSSQAMYNAKWFSPLVTAPLDTCNFDQWNGEVYKQLLAANNSAHLHVTLLLENYQVWWDNGGRDYSGMLPFSPTTGTDVLYDAQAAWMAGQLISNVGLVPLTMKSLPLLVNTNGFTVIDDRQQNMVNAAIGFDTANPYSGSDMIGSSVIQSIIAAQ